MYECYRDEFNSYFKDNSDFYWKLFVLKIKNNYSYQKIAEENFCSETNAKVIVKKVLNFFENINDKLIELEYSFDTVMMPNQFIYGGLCRLSHNATLILYYAIGLYQKTFFEKMMIPRSYLMKLKKNYKNKPYRFKLLEELKNLKIVEKNGNLITIFKFVEELKGNILFSFTEDCLDYINIWRYMTKKYFYL